MEFERDVEQHLVRAVTRAGGICLKHGQDGWPDRIVILPGGRTIWAELKRSTGELAPLQQLRAAELQRCGAEVVCLWSKEEVDKLLLRYARERE